MKKDRKNDNITILFMIILSLMIVRICDANRQILSTKSYSVTENTSVQKNIEEVKEDKIEKRIVVDDTINLETYINNRYPKVPKKVAKKIAAKVVKYSEKHKVKLPFIVAIIEVESKFNSMASSGKGDEGLMQVRYSVWKKKFNIKRKKDLYDINKNIEIGVSILKYYLDRSHGNISLALHKYCGSNKSRYTSKVNKAMKRYNRWRVNEEETT
jgi:soluble lytic murein transglycosylase-like protein